MLNLNTFGEQKYRKQSCELVKVRLSKPGFKNLCVKLKSPENKYSLNDCLKVGPNLIPQLFHVLVKFRSDPIALTAAIEKAFLMVSMNAACLLYTSDAADE